MATGALFAHGTFLKIGDGATPTEVFTTISEVTDLAGPNMSLAALVATSHDSAGWAEKIGGILDAGQVTFTVNFKPTHATHSYTQGLIKDMKDRTLRNFKLVFTDSGNTTWSFAALVTAFEPAEPVDEKLSANITLDISGLPTLAG
jgi:predicted secreted protein